jgi:hypothetical protein
MDFEREGVKIDWVRVLEASECSNILLPLLPLLSFVGECILEVAVVLYLYHDITSPIYYQVAVRRPV